MDHRKTDQSKTYSQLYNKWLFYEKVSTVFSILGLISVITAYELDIHQFNHIEFGGVGKYQNEEVIFAHDFGELAAA
jgi:hypothetical protein